MHIPVLQTEVLEYLAPKSNENFLDCTFGEGGHTVAILEKNKPEGKVLGIEIDSELYQKLKLRMAEFPNRLILVNDSYLNLKKNLKKYNFQPDGILFDLGLSSWHLEESKRGFSFQRNETLDMRYNSELTDLTAQKIIYNFSQSEIEKILKIYGEERFAKKIANQLIKERKSKPIKTTFQLVEIVKKATPSWYHHKRIHFATRTFQALRIAVNKELDSLEKGLKEALDILKPQGRLVVISFHSLEDRIVKNFLRDQAKRKLLKILTKKPIQSSQEEIKINPRSRSAKLRAAEKIKL